MAIGKLSAAQVERLIRGLACETDRVAFTHHARTRMRQRQMTRDMVLEILRRGRLVREPEPNLRFGTLECRMERYLAGRQIAAVVAIADDEATLLVVTVINA